MIGIHVSNPPKEDTVRAAGARDALDVVMRYHQETKHHFFRYARAPGYMDWANQVGPATKRSNGCE